MKKKKEKILVAMSGGVDSSVAAAMLVQQGYDVTGAFMLNYDGLVNGVDCWRGDYRDALRVAAKLGIPLLKLDFIKEYKKMVLDAMFVEYKKGRTPNPDVMCNKFVKFGVWLDWARAHGFDKLATGHYARIKLQVATCHLQLAKDTNKDQTYFLHQLSQEQLAHVLFPIGEYTKPEVRKLAKKFGLTTAEKEESMGICFIGEVPMKEFLQKKIKLKPGKIVLSGGEVIGEHEGLAFYTIGQRHVWNIKNQISNIKNQRPLYVVEKLLSKNELVVGYEDDALLYKKEVAVSGVHWISGHEPKFPLKCLVRLRHRQPLQESRIKNLESRIVIEFKKPQRAVTPGQFAVVYNNGECMGGGVII